MKLSTFLGGLLASSAAAQACIYPPTARFKPVMDPEYTSTLLIDGLTAPRGMIFDPAGRLLFVDKGVGVKAITLNETSCDAVCVVSVNTIINDPSLNHGIALSIVDEDGSGPQLYVSNQDTVYRYGYNVTAGCVTGQGWPFISNMANKGDGGHFTRTLLLVNPISEFLLISRGSEGYVDHLAAFPKTGHSTIKYFHIYSLSGDQPYGTPDFVSEGAIFASGLRNSVGLTIHPITGGIWSVENSMDDLHRLGIDIHNNNPAEELNYHGPFAYVETNPLMGANYGYPSCVAAYDPSTLCNPEITVGQQFYANISKDQDLQEADLRCSSAKYQAPKVALPAHTAPLDIKFLPDGSAAFISLHGSWDRSPPDGYRLMRIDFGKDGMPTSMPLAGWDIMKNPDITKCPGDCFRPTGLAIDEKGRVFMSSDSTGEIYLIMKTPEDAYSSPGCTGATG